MTEFFVHRTQHAVGQGGFHMANITLNNQNFRYIYDCGSKNKSVIPSVLTQLCPTVEEKKIDWLVISSFDLDHFNGVGKLLDAGYTFNKVFLPHRLSKKFHVWLLCIYILRGLTTKDILMAFKILNYLDSLPKDNESQPSLVQKIATIETTPVKGVTYEVLNYDWVLRFYSLEHNFENAVNELLNGKDFDDLRTLVDKAGNLLKPLHLKMNDVAATGLATDILREIAVVLKNPPNSQTGAAANPSSAAGGADTIAGAASGADAAAPTPVKTRSGDSVKKLLSKAYENLKENETKIFPDYNSVSLCMYSGPRSAIGKTYCQFRLTYYGGAAPSLSQHDRTGRTVGWLGVGDIGFSTPTELDLFSRYYRANLSVTATRTVPHHGSQSSYGKDLVRLKPFLTLGAENPVWIAAANPLASYRHPDGIVVIECGNYGEFRLVAENPDESIDEFIHGIQPLPMSIFS